MFGQTIIESSSPLDPGSLIVGQQGVSGVLTLKDGNYFVSGTKLIVIETRSDLISLLPSLLNKNVVLRGVYGGEGFYVDIVVSVNGQTITEFPHEILPTPISTTTVVPTEQATLIAGFPSWSIFLLLGIGLFFLFGKRR